MAFLHWFLPLFPPLFLPPFPYRYLHHLHHSTTILPDSPPAACHLPPRFILSTQLLEYGQVGSKLPESASLVTFPLAPKPHQAVVDENWIKLHWLGGKARSDTGGRKADWVAPHDRGAELVGEEAEGVGGNEAEERARPESGRPQAPQHHSEADGAIIEDCD